MSKPLPHFARLIGEWSSEATHPKMPGVTVRGTATFEWLEGQQFVIMRSRNEHPDFPDAISIIGYTDRDTAEGTHGDQLTMSYFDSRGVARIYDFEIDDNQFTFSREGSFPQRLTCRFEGDTIVGTSQVKEDGAWNDDLAITYRR